MPSVLFESLRHPATVRFLSFFDSQFSPETSQHELVDRSHEIKPDVYRFACGDTLRQTRGGILRRKQLMFHGGFFGSGPNIRILSYRKGTVRKVWFVAPNGSQQPPA